MRSLLYHSSTARILCTHPYRIREQTPILSCAVGNSFLIRWEFVFDSDAELMRRWEFVLIRWEFVFDSDAELIMRRWEFVLIRWEFVFDSDAELIMRRWEFVFDSDAVQQYGVVLCMCVAIV